MRARHDYLSLSAWHESMVKLKANKTDTGSGCLSLESETSDVPWKHIMEYPARRKREKARDESIQQLIIRDVQLECEFILRRFTDNLSPTSSEQDTCGRISRVVSVEEIPCFLKMKRWGLIENIFDSRVKLTDRLVHDFRTHVPRTQVWQHKTDNFLLTNSCHDATISTHFLFFTVIQNT